MHCWARYMLWLVIAILGIGNIFIACGHKADLYLPEHTSEQIQEQTQAKPQGRKDD